MLAILIAVGLGLGAALIIWCALVVGARSEEP